jgi:hypothetical protein
VRPREETTTSKPQRLFGNDYLASTAIWLQRLKQNTEAKYPSAPIKKGREEPTPFLPLLQRVTTIDQATRRMQHYFITFRTHLMQSISVRHASIVNSQNTGRVDRSAPAALAVDSFEINHSWDLEGDERTGPWTSPGAARGAAALIGRSRGLQGVWVWVQALLQAPRQAKAKKQETVVVSPLWMWC